MNSRVLALVSAIALVLPMLSPVSAHDGHPEHAEGEQEGGWPGSARAQEVARAMLADSQPAVDAEAQAGEPCDPNTGLAGGVYPCDDVDLAAFMPLADIGGGKANDIWGWTDPDDLRGPREYALLGRTSGTSFVDITDPYAPTYLGNLPTTRFSSTWRDVKAYANHVFVVSEARNHGMQVFDMTRLRTVSGPPVTFSADARYTGFNTAHNIAINEASGFAYAVGTDTCSGGLHMVDIRDPLNPVSAGCYSDDGYTHDAQCVIYHGPDTTFNGRELCFAANEDTVTIVDVTDKSAPQQVARVGYDGAEYTHQGWLTEDHAYFLVDDELDEDRNGHNTHTYVFDVSNIRSPSVVGTNAGTTGAIDHNQYVLGNHSYQSNYRGGLRILELTDLANATLNEVAFFDTYPDDNNTDFNGSWSNYPFFASGTVIVSDIERGLFILRPNLGPANASPSATLEQPPDGATVGGSVAVEISAIDTEDADGTLTVEWNVDGGTWRAATYDSTSGTYLASWNTTAVDNGSHSLTARAIDSGGASATDSHAITVDNPNAAPTASFTHTCSELVCDFDASGSTDGDGSITTYAWDFGDGTSGTGMTVQHSYSAGGTYTVVLTVTDNDGDTGSAQQTISIEGPTATMHVGDLDGRSQLKGKSGRWEVFVTITVHDSFEQPVEGATVTGSWSGALEATATATTAGDGTVTISTGGLSGGDSVTFTVEGGSHATLTYASADNHDVDETDSTGTVITVKKT